MCVSLRVCLWVYGGVMLDATESSSFISFSYLSYLSSVVFKWCWFFTDVFFSNWFLLQLPSPSWPDLCLPATCFWADSWIYEMELYVVSYQMRSPRAGFVWVDGLGQGVRCIEFGVKTWWFLLSPSMRGWELRCLWSDYARCSAGFDEVLLDGNFQVCGYLFGRVSRYHKRTGDARLHDMICLLLLFICSNCWHIKPFPDLMKRNLRESVVVVYSIWDIFLLFSKAI